MTERRPGDFPDISPDISRRASYVYAPPRNRTSNLLIKSQLAGEATTTRDRAIGPVSPPNSGQNSPDISPDNTYYPYQLEGAAWLSRRRRRYLGDEPGLGKTRTALLAARFAGARKVAVICPAIVRAHWTREWETLGLTEHFDLTTDSYNRIVLGDVAERLKAAGPDVLILDEAHYLKHPTSKRTQILLGKTGVARHTGTVWPLSGTPMPRNPLELWPVLVSLFPRRLVEAGITTEDGFLNHFCHYVQSPYGPRVVGVRHANELRELLDGVILRRTLDEIALDLPAIRWGVKQITITPQSMREAARIGRELPDAVRAALQNGTPLPQLASQLATARRLLGEIKAPFAAEYVRGLLDEGAGPLVVFAYHRAVLDVLAQELPCLRIDGSTPPSVREHVIEAFQRGGVPVFLGQITACSTGITLTKSARVVIVEPDWSADVNVQAGKRVHRIGQNRPALVEMLAMGGTLDAAIVRQHHREVRMVEEVMG